MTEPYYRSPIDKLVVESGFTATLIAQQMNIKYHRMVALRRLKDVQEQDIELCKQAIAEIMVDKIDKKIKTKQGPRPKAWKVESTQIIQSKKMGLSQQIRSLSFLLGQTLAFLNLTLDSLKATTELAPEVLKHHQKLNEQCDKLLNV